MIFFLNTSCYLLKPEQRAAGETVVLPWLQRSNRDFYLTSADEIVLFFFKAGLGGLSSTPTAEDSCRVETGQTNRPWTWLFNQLCIITALVWNGVMMHSCFSVWKGSVYRRTAVFFQSKRKWNILSGADSLWDSAPCRPTRARSAWKQWVLINSLTRPIMPFHCTALLS